MSVVVNNMMVADGGTGYVNNGDSQSLEAVTLGLQQSLNQTQLQLKVKNLTYPTLNSLIVAMSRGVPVKIAAFGDSTTDGSGTTGYVRNDSTGTIIPSVTGTGAPVGQSEHTSEAPKAWPNLLQTTLRDMYSNPNISIFNAGYGGQVAFNGWARLNYANAVTLNPFYGKPDACFWGFGLNDVNQSTIRIVEYITETELWIQERLEEDVLPILLTNDSTSTQGDSNNFALGRENVEIELHVNSAMRSLAAKYNIPIIDVNNAMLQQKNFGEWSWEQIQPDALHYGDIGHAIKAGYIASKLYPNIICSKQNSVEKITWRDRRSNWSLKATDTLGGYDNITGAPTTSWLAEAADYTSGQVLMTLWVYCDGVMPRLIYRSGHSCSDDVSVRTRPVAELPHIRVTNQTNGTVPYYNHPVSGSGQLAVPYAMNRPFSLVDLKVGLNKVQLIAPVTSSTYSIYGGYFEINSNWISHRKTGDFYMRSTGMNSSVHKPYFQTDALRGQGRMNFSKTFTSGGILVSAPAEAVDGSNCMSITKVGDIVEVLIEARLGVSTGVVIGCGGILDGDLATASNGEKCLLLFNSNGNLGLYEVGDKYSNTTAFSVLKSPVSHTWSPDGEGLYPLKCRVRMTQVDKSNYTVQVYSGWYDNGALITSYDTRVDNHAAFGDKRSPPLAGTVGGFFFNASNNSTRTIDISTVLIRHFLT